MFLHYSELERRVCSMSQGNTFWEFVFACW
jgi:hypothetical protein